MKLSEFVKKRKEELGLTWNDIMDGGIAHNTFSRIVNDKQLTMKASTMEKLARILKCTIGELQACMAEVPNPLREEAERQEGIAGISITARPGKSKKDEVDKVMKEKPDVAPEPEQEEEVDVMFPPEMDDEADTIRVTREVAEAVYKRKLKDICMKHFANMCPGDDSTKTFAEIGHELVNEILK